MNTKLTLIYTDAHGHKSYLDVVLRGQMTPRQSGIIYQSLHDNEFLIADQVGLPTPSEQMSQNGPFPTSDDHVWSSIQGDMNLKQGKVGRFFTDEAHTIDMTVEQFAQRMKAVNFDVSAEMARLGIPTDDLGSLMGISDDCKGEPAPVRRVVITHPEFGVYLGSAMGMGFWSQIDSAGQQEAVTFSNIDDAKAHIRSWDENNRVEPYSFLGIDVSPGTQHVNAEQIVAAGGFSYLGELALNRRAQDIPKLTIDLVVDQVVQGHHLEHSTYQIDATDAILGMGLNQALAIKSDTRRIQELAQGLLKQGAEVSPQGLDLETLDGVVRIVPPGDKRIRASFCALKKYWLDRSSVAHKPGHTTSRNSQFIPAM